MNSVQFTKAHALPLMRGTDRADARVQASAAAPALRKGGLLDLPFIYRQIMDGCSEGVYSERFLSVGGGAHLFRLLLLNLLPFGKLLGKHKLYDFLIFRNGRDNIGYAGIYTSTQTVEPKGCTIIGFFGIAREYRGKKKGSLMMRQLLAHLPADGRIAAYTTKYAVGMHHLLSKAKFRRTAEFAACKQKVFILDRRGAR